MTDRHEPSRLSAASSRPGRLRIALLALLAGSGLVMGGCPPEGLSDPTVQTGLRAIADGVLDVLFAVYGDDSTD
ncbi:MAG: hypothetical protein JXO22_11565 [Phycisphaerae bacterium]|nr:hypothetical protein [Phycisphaerae bacterium]